jgi:hypothetical protein
MSFEHIVMGIIVFVLGSLYAAMLWTERDNKRLEKELKEISAKK